MQNCPAASAVRTEGVAAGLTAMEVEFRDIDENGSWTAIYQVGPPANEGGSELKLMLLWPNNNNNN